MTDIPPLTIGETLGSDGGSTATYRIMRHLGKGGAGSVYRAEILATCETVVIKVPRAWGSVPDIMHEARYLERERFPHVARIRALDWTLHPQLGLEMPFLVLDGYVGSLYQRMVSQPSLSTAQALGWIGDCARGLQAVQLVHRDLKPENILLDAQDRAWVCDFGLALPASEVVRRRMGIHIGGSIAGSLMYMTPEQIYEAEDLDCRSDIYSLGLILFELVTGSLAHPRQLTGQSVSDYLCQVALAEIPWQQVRERAVAEIVRVATAKSRRERYQDLWAFLDALEEACVPGAPISAQ